MNMPAPNVSVRPWCLPVWGAALLAGCVHMPPPTLTREISPAELEEQVNFLASPALKGRAPRTLGSMWVRQYLRRQFKACGLVPWKQTGRYDQPFRLGTNVVGVLPGSDERLANEFVLISAHYDHLGTREGRLYPGAADNASGVAVLCELAERFALQPSRMKHSLVFVAFDCEEEGCVGAYSFTSRRDFRSQDIAGVINLDIIGRTAFDVLNRTLLVAGAQDFPGLYRQLVDVTTAAGIRGAFLGTDLLGPVADHVAFEAFNVPCLFLRTGYFRDYHGAADTPDKLDYGLAKSVGDVVYSVAHNLANADQLELRGESKETAQRELMDIAWMLREIVRAAPNVGLSPREDSILSSCGDEAERLAAAPGYDRSVRQRFRRELLQSVLPIVIRHIEHGRIPEDVVEANSWANLVALEMFAENPSFVVESTRSFIAKCMNQSSLLLATRGVTMEECTLEGDTIRLTPGPRGEQRLSLLFPRLTLQWSPGRGTRRGGGYYWLDCRGSARDIIDRCLLGWRRTRQIPSYAAVWDRVLSTVAAGDHGDSYREWLRWRIDAESESGSPESQWWNQLLGSDNPDVLRAALAAPPVAPSAKDVPRLCEIIAARSRISAVVRSFAIKAIPTESCRDKNALHALIDVLHDDVPTRGEADNVAFDRSNPFYDHPATACQRWATTKWLQNHSETLADVALKKLRELTAEDFGKDAAAWRQWMDSNPAGTADRRHGQ